MIDGVQSGKGEEEGVSYLDLRPAVLFDEITDYPAGYRVLVGMHSAAQRIALSMGLERKATRMELLPLLREKLKDLTVIPPVVVQDGPITENVFDGADVDILKFPTPMWHELDGGRYLGTGSATITRDLEEGWVNLGTYRVMIHDSKTIACYICPGRHSHIHRQKFVERGEPCPIAISFGHDPLLFAAASGDVPYGVSEYEWAGGIKGRAIPVIIGEHTGLPIPAHSEIAIEGEVVFSETRPEGPFAEWTGYYGSMQRQEPIIKVKRLMHRNDPIITGVARNRPPNESSFSFAFFRSARIWDYLEVAGVPDVRGVWCHETAGVSPFIVVSIKQRYPGHARQALGAVSSCRDGAHAGRYVIVVDEDIDPSNLADVIWAMSSRSDPAEDIDFLRNCWSSALDPMIPSEEKDYCVNSRALIDACRPYKWKDRFPPVAECSPQLRQEVIPEVESPGAGVKRDSGTWSGGLAPPHPAPCTHTRSPAPRASSPCS
ncbi:MAG: UbiD family decarboxylase [Firmicutes bacterium]|nr:UbiD family decarboxylase [Bacillota bacterium]